VSLNLLNLEDRREKQSDHPLVISIASWRRIKFNQSLMKLFFGKLGLDRIREKVRSVYDEVSLYEAIAA